MIVEQCAEFVDWTKWLVGLLITAICALAGTVAILWRENKVLWKGRIEELNVAAADMKVLVDELMGKKSRGR